MQQPTPPPEELNCIAMLRELRGGEFIDQLNAALIKVTDAVSEHGKSGSITIKLTVTSSGRSLEIDDDIGIKCPKAEKVGTIFFRDRAGLLTRDDPKQHQLPFTIELVREPIVPPSAPTSTASS